MTQFHLLKVYRNSTNNNYIFIWNNILFKEILYWWTRLVSLKNVDTCSCSFCDLICDKQNFEDIRKTTYFLSFCWPNLPTMLNFPNVDIRIIHIRRFLNLANESERLNFHRNCVICTSRARFRGFYLLVYNTNSICHPIIVLLKI